MISSLLGDKTLTMEYNKSFVELSLTEAGYALQLMT